MIEIEVKSLRLLHKFLLDSYFHLVSCRSKYQCTYMEFKIISIEYCIE